MKTFLEGNLALTIPFQTIWMLRVIIAQYIQIFHAIDELKYRLLSGYVCISTKRKLKCALLVSYVYFTDPWTGAYFETTWWINTGKHTSVRTHKKIIETRKSITVLCLCHNRSILGLLFVLFRFGHKKNNDRA